MGGRICAHQTIAQFNYTSRCQHSHIRNWIWWEYFSSDISSLSISIVLRYCGATDYCSYSQIRYLSIHYQIRSKCKCFPLSSLDAALQVGLGRDGPARRSRTAAECLTRTNLIKEAMFLINLKWWLVPPSHTRSDSVQTDTAPIFNSIVCILWWSCYWFTFIFTPSSLLMFIPVTVSPNF